MINGIIVLNKPRGMTSSDCVYKLRKILQIRKIGHAGTLDPEVDGVLPIAVGQATKLIERMHLQTKSYIGQGMFGKATDSYDLDGKELKQKAILNPILSSEITLAMNKLTGEIEQVPPIYSSVRVNGKHLYEYARNNIPVERPKRNVKVYEYKLIREPEYDSSKKTEYFDFSIKCSKGTYVRSLVNDLGEVLNYPAVMTKLTRVASSGYELSQAVSFEDIENNLDSPQNWLQPIDSFFDNLSTVILSDKQYADVKNGVALELEINSQEVALSYNNRIKAIYYLKDGQYRPKLMLLRND